MLLATLAAGSWSVSQTHALQVAPVPSKTAHNSAATLASQNPRSRTPFLPIVNRVPTRPPQDSFTSDPGFQVQNMGNPNPPAPFPQVAAPAISDSLAPEFIVSESFAAQSLLKVPPAPPVDQSTDPHGRPLSVQSNAATMPDEFYRKSWCNLGDPVHFVDRPDLGLRIGGWDQIGWHSQDNGLFNNRRRRINLHQMWGFVEKDFQTNRGMGVKLRGDLVYGIDAQRFQAFGNEPFAAPEDWDNSWDNGAFGWAAPQFYSEFELQRGKVRAGRFLSPFGFENAAAVENFFYSHTYTYTLTQPHTLSGVVGEANLSASTSAFAGATNGWDTSFGDVGLSGVAGFTHRFDRNRMLTYGTSFGEFGSRGTGFFQSLVYAVQASEKVQLAVQSDWLTADQSDDFGLIGYGIYRFNPCLAAGARVEYWETDPGISKDQSALAFTSGLNYRPHANVVLRPEARFDYNGAAVAKGDLNLGLDVVITF